MVSRAEKTKVSRKKGRSSSLNEARVNLMTMGPEGAKITNASQLVFFTTATDRNPAKSSMDMRNDRIIGDVNCVGYKLLYRDQILDQDATAESDGFPVYSLYRNLISAVDTVRNLLGQQDLAACPLLHAQQDLAVAAQPGFIQQVAGGRQFFQFRRDGSAECRKRRPHIPLVHQSTSTGLWFSLRGRPYLSSASRNGSGLNSSTVYTPGLVHSPVSIIKAPHMAGTPVV